MENPEFRNNAENFHPWKCDFIEYPWLLVEK